MAVTIDISAKKITLDQLLGIFDILCKSLDIVEFHDDNRRLSNLGHPRLQQEGRLEYWLCDGGKFTIEGRDDMTEITVFFKGEEERYEIFYRKVKEYFERK
ncbi:MAG: hypothetical protein KAT43_03395 [Nanoarchaeota archaeon]|nr:hypothetical protein [Nanoarchaeota archaeon]